MNCAKQITTCTITTVCGKKYYGENDCLVKQDKCPREEGEGYDKCKSVCFQIGHAEEVAVHNALKAGAKLEGATAEIGHHRICDNCNNLLANHGISNIILNGINK